MSYLTIEEVADRLNMTVTQVRESRRKGEWPGNVGKLQGRRLRFNADLIESGPQEPTTTSDPVEALLWTAQGIEAKLGEILKELRRPGPQSWQDARGIVVNLTDKDAAELIRKDGRHHHD